MKVLVTGANGMLGKDLVRIFAPHHELLATDIDTLDIRDREAVQRCVEVFRPNMVMHLAAMTDVDGCERRPDDAYLTNTIGTENVALACQATNALMVYISTISVFDGTSQTPNTEYDRPNPMSVYSASKYQGELIVERLLSRYYIVRAGWMFGGGPEDKKFVARILELARANPQVKGVSDKFGSPTYTVDFAQGLLQLIAMGRYGLYHQVNTGIPCTRADVARVAIAAAGLTANVIEVSSAEFPLPAHRPRMEAARNYHLDLVGSNWMRPWEEALREYVQTTLIPTRE